MKIIVIGSLAAGVSAADKISAGHRNVSITTYERGRFYSCGTCGLPYYIGKSRDVLAEVLRRKGDALISRGIKVCACHEVTRIDAARHMISVTDLVGGKTFEDRFDKLVLATGSHVIVPAVPGNDKMGVQTLKNVEDLLFISEFTRTPYVQDIVVLGGGYAGIEIAKAFMRMGRHVRIIDRERYILSDFDREVSDKIAKELMDQGLEFSLGEEVTAFIGKTFIEKVRTSKGEYSCDLCVSAMGLIPESSLAAGVGVKLSRDGAIMVNSDLETNVGDIYAAGSCSRSAEPIRFTGSIRAHDFEIARTGYTEAQAKKAGLSVRSTVAAGEDRPGIVPNPNRVSIKLIYDSRTRRVVGAEAWGRKNVAARINSIAVAVAAGMTVEELGGVDFVYSSGMSSIWDPIQIVCNSAK